MTDPDFERKVRMVRVGLLHLANGLDESLHDVDGGDDLLEERLWSLRNNVDNILEIAGWPVRPVPFEWALGSGWADAD